MFWKKKKPKKKREKVEIRAYSEEGGFIKSLERQGLTTSASYGGMGIRELQLRMELLVEPVLSAQRGVFEPAKNLAEFPKVDQDRFLSTVEQLCNTDIELGFNFCHLGHVGLQTLDESQWDDWISKLLKNHQENGLNSAIEQLHKVKEYVASISHAPASVSINDISRILESFVIGLSGRRLNIEISDQHFCDTESIRLPEFISTYNNQDENFTLYKAMTVHQWAQTWFGTWRMNVDALVKTFKDSERAQSIFHKLETIRLDACIARELPGVARVMKNISGTLNTDSLSKNWKRAHEVLQQKDATVKDTMFFLESVYKENLFPEDKIYQGTLEPRRTWKTIQSRIEKEQEQLQQRLTELQQELDTNVVYTNTELEDSERFSIEEIEDEDSPEGFSIQLNFNEQAIDPPEDIQQLLQSILQDLGEIPDPYLITEIQNEEIETEYTTDQPNLDDSNTIDKDKVYLYDEWDHSRQRYRKEWCHLREHDIKPVYNNFVDETLFKHRSLLKHLHRTFEALREDDKRLKHQPYGEDIDLDAVIEAYSDTQIGLEASQNLFIKSRKMDRNIAVMFMIDMSGSTTGWVNEMERVSLILLCEALETLGDRYAIYGFSGATHESCELYKIKNFKETYNDEIKARINGIEPQDYTRMGAAIRHLTMLLNQIEARTKLLITLSDGRPDDRDGYRGPYGIEDTRRALIEAKFLGIHPFCITIDQEAMDYLKHMYGAVNFAVVDKVDKLPYKVSDIYRRITN